MGGEAYPNVVKACVYQLAVLWQLVDALGLQADAEGVLLLEAVDVDEAVARPPLKVLAARQAGVDVYWRESHRAYLFKVKVESAPIDLTRHQASVHLEGRRGEAARAVRMSQDELRLCRLVLRSHFGEVVEVPPAPHPPLTLLQRTAATLTLRRALPLPLIVQWSKQSSKHVREALFVLIQHNLVQYRPSGQDDDAPAAGAPLYRLDIDQVILRLAYPVFASLLEERFSTRVTALARRALTARRPISLRLLSGTGGCRRLPCPARTCTTSWRG